MGGILYDRGDYKGALNCYQKSLDIYEDLCNLAGMSSCYINMGNILSSRGDYEGALKLYQKSLKINEELGDRAGMSICYQNIGLVYKNCGKKSEALEMYQKCLSLKQELGLPIPSWLPATIKELRGWIGIDYDERYIFKNPDWLC